LDTTSIQFDAYFAVSTASTDELSIEQNLVIYPNPMKEKVTVVLPTVVNEERVRCAVRDLSGRTLFDLDYSNKQSSLEIDTHSLSGGIYVIEVMNESGKSLGKGKCVKL
jgi:hypothetical protein